MAHSLKTYLVQAVYSWCVDQHFTPHIVAYVNEHTMVPESFVSDDKHIVLSIGPKSCVDLMINDRVVQFTTSFSGVPVSIKIPLGHIVKIFAKENTVGLDFPLEECLSPMEDSKKVNKTSSSKKRNEKSKSSLKVIK